MIVDDEPRSESADRQLGVVDGGIDVVTQRSVGSDLPQLVGDRRERVLRKRGLLRAELHPNRLDHDLFRRTPFASAAR